MMISTSLSSGHFTSCTMTAILLLALLSAILAPSSQTWQVHARELKNVDPPSSIGASIVDNNSGISIGSHRRHTSSRYHQRSLLDNHNNSNHKSSNSNIKGSRGDASSRFLQFDDAFGTLEGEEMMEGSTLPTLIPTDEDGWNEDGVDVASSVPSSSPTVVSFGEDGGGEGDQGEDEDFGLVEGETTTTTTTTTSTVAESDTSLTTTSTTPAGDGTDYSTVPADDGATTTTTTTTTPPEDGDSSGLGGDDEGEGMGSQSPSASPSAPGGEFGEDEGDQGEDSFGGEEEMITLSAAPSAAPSVTGGGDSDNVNDNDGGDETGGTLAPSAKPSGTPTVTGGGDDNTPGEETASHVPTPSPVYDWDSEGGGSSSMPTPNLTTTDDDFWGEGSDDEWGEQQEGGGDNNPYWWNKEQLPTFDPTPRPTFQYVPKTDDPLANEEGDVPVGEFDDDKFGGIKGKIDTYMHGVESPEEMENDKNVQVVAGVLVSVFVLLWLVTAHQVMENPDGLCAGICRLILKLLCCIIRILCLPCRFLCCKGSDQSRSRRTHSPMRSEFPTDLELA